VCGVVDGITRSTSSCVSARRCVNAHACVDTTQGTRACILMCTLLSLCIHLSFSHLLIFLPSPPSLPSPFFCITHANSTWACKERYISSKLGANKNVPSKSVTCILHVVCHFMPYFTYLAIKPAECLHPLMNHPHKNKRKIKELMCPLCKVLLQL